MNKAEAALRKCDGGAPARAVRILDSWTDADRQSFRTAYHNEDWLTVCRLCKLTHDMDYAYSATLFLHLWDATAPETSERRSRPERRTTPERRAMMERRALSERRRKVIRGFFPERRHQPDRRKSVAS